MRNKKISGVGRPFLLAQGSMGSGLSMEGGDSGEEACTGGLKGSDKEGSGSLKEGASPPQLIPRGGDMMEEMKRERSVLNGSTGSSRSSSGSMEQKSISPPKTPVNSSSAPSPYGPGSRLECDSAHLKQAHYLMIRPHPQPPPHQPQSSELCYQDPRPPYDAQPYQPASDYYFSVIHHHKPCMARFLRSSHVPESSLPPSMAPLYSEQHPSLPPPREHAGPSPYGPPPVPQYGPLAPAHGGYAPLYDSRHMWRPQLYHREDARSNSLPPEVLHSSVYQPPLRERYASLDSPYCSAGEHRAALHRDSLGRVPLGYEDLFRRKQEQWAHHHHGNVNRPSQSSPVFTVDFGAEVRRPARTQCVCTSVVSHNHRTRERGMGDRDGQGERPRESEGEGGRETDRERGRERGGETEGERRREGVRRTGRDCEGERERLRGRDCEGEGEMDRERLRGREGETARERGRDGQGE
uniref:Uncharacterized protein n=1 Tax=Hucho hucho TaxID=62062 RepID=A0A4W5JM77_9TELE